MTFKYIYDFGGDIDIGSLVGKVVVEASSDDEAIKLILDGGEHIHLVHQQDCCEDVYLDDVCGDLQDLVGSPLLVAEEVEGETSAMEGSGDYDTEDSYTWTFYKLDTAKGGIVARWFGSSNGYYSESVSVVYTNRREIH
jgi:hypothetical protein